MDDAVKYTKLALSRWADFQGRSRRAEYWWFALASFALYVVINVADAILRVIPLLGGLLSLVLVLVLLVVSLALIVPSFAVGFRRLHDTDRSAWWLLLGLIPLLGAIVLIVFLATKGTAGPNKYGPDPIEVEPVPAPSAIGDLVNKV